MSCIRDVRLLIARHLDLPTDIRAAVLNVLNVTDAALDTEGWQEGDDVKAALRTLDSAILNMNEVIEDDDEGDDPLDDDDLIDIDDIDILDDEDDDDGENA